MLFALFVWIALQKIVLLWERKNLNSSWNWSVNASPIPSIFYVRRIEVKRERNILCKKWAFLQVVYLGPRHQQHHVVHPRSWDNNTKEVFTQNGPNRIKITLRLGSSSQDALYAIILVLYYGHWTSSGIPICSKQTSLFL